MALLSLASLLLKETKTTIYEKGLAIATTLGLPVTSWAAGDPTRSLYHYMAEILSTLELTIAEFCAAGFLDYATGDWLTILAKQVFNFDRTAATYATTTVTLTNGGGGLFVIAAGDLTFKNTATGKTYRNTTGGTLNPSGATLAVTVVADEAGSASSAGAGAIDALVTTLLGVTCTNATAATGTDTESDASVRQGCRDKLGSLSPNGPKDAYVYVARNSKLTGTTGITRARSSGNTTTGVTTVYLAGPSGAVSGADRTLAETAILKWATPQCITPTVLSATNVVIAVTYTVEIYTSVGKTQAEVEAAVLAKLQEMFPKQPIGGNSGFIHSSLVVATIRTAFPDHIYKITTTMVDTALTAAQVATLGTVTPTVTFITDP